MNFDLKIALVKRFGSQVRAARALEICESRLSNLINGHRTPKAEEREILKAALGADYFEEPEGPRAA
jgi:hypothetical protein